MSTAALVRLGPALGGVGVTLTELTGREEAAVTGTDTANAVALLDAVVDWRGSERGPAAELAAGDRDRLLAAVYTRHYGDRVQRTAACAGCGASYDFELSVGDLAVEMLRPRRAVRWLAWDPRAPGGAFEEAERTVRLPTGRDEIAAARLDGEEAVARLRAACLLPGKVAPTEEEVAALLEAAAPTLDVDLDAACPECGTANEVPFSMQAVLLGALRAEQGALWAEVHRLASAYGWPLAEILALPRSVRRRLVDHVRAERRAHRGA